MIDSMPHRRYNILTGEWVLVSPHRTKRPWQGQEESSSNTQMPEYDPECYLCPGNPRAGGMSNPNYTGTFSFINDFSSLLPEDRGDSGWNNGLLTARGERGICKVICFSPRHDLTLARMNNKNINNVVSAWQKEYIELGNEDFISYVQIFENRGETMGCSNPHPHGQIWANEHIPDIPRVEGEHQKGYKEKTKSCLLCDYMDKEMEEQKRIISENDSFLLLVPFWAVWPYEVMILPKRHLSSIDEMSEKETLDLADTIKENGIRYDNLFKTSFPYSMGIHQKPTDGQSHSEWHFHFHYYPPLLRSAHIRKFMVGYEMLGMAQRDITAEYAAQVLRESPQVHYLESREI